MPYYCISYQPKASSKTEPLRFPSDHRMFTQLADILVTGKGLLKKFYFSISYQQGGKERVFEGNWRVMVVRAVLSAVIGYWVLSGLGWHGKSWDFTSAFSSHGKGLTCLKSQEKS